MSKMSIFQVQNLYLLGHVNGTFLRLVATDKTAGVNENTVGDTHLKYF